jgi:energy-converting hydrogenase Eha subunit A
VIVPDVYAVQFALKYLGALAMVTIPSAVKAVPIVANVVPSRLPWKATVAVVIPVTCRNAGCPASACTAVEAPVATTAFNRVLA